MYFHTLQPPDSKKKKNLILCDNNHVPIVFYIRNEFEKLFISIL